MDITTRLYLKSNYRPLITEKLELYEKLILEGRRIPLELFDKSSQMGRRRNRRSTLDQSLNFLSDPP